LALADGVLPQRFHVFGTELTRLRALDAKTLERHAA
jgi:hypothetical protein